MRLIDGDALEKEGWSLHRTVRVDMHTSEYQIKPIAKVPTIDPVRKGKWVDGRCNQCDYHALYWPMASTYTESKYCPCCGAKMGEGD